MQVWEEEVFQILIWSEPMEPQPRPPPAVVGEEATLLIRHLPESIPLDTLSRLFSHYGASTVRPCSHSRVRNCAFVDFKNHASASRAQQHLNGLRFLGKVLSVQPAIKQVGKRKSQDKESGIGNDSTSFTKLTDDEKSRVGSYIAREPIAERLGVDYPFPPHLEYAYPLPDGNILTNIVNALIAVPRFYTQVLHLMNKMNIPAPFRAPLPTPPLPTSVPDPPPVPPPPVPPPPLVTNAGDSSDESEMESSDEDASALGRPKAKRMKGDSVVGPAVDKDVVHEAVGLKPAALLPKEIPIIKKKNPVLQIRIAPKQIQNEPMDSTENEQVESDKEILEDKTFATVEELKGGKLPPEEILSLPMFKNYTAGNPSPVLYIKNLSKDVVADDFYFVFGSLFGGNDAAKTSLNVKLMQEGRMRGQAFITFPSIELAQDALNLVNGYVFKGKPMIIQFGRNPGAAKAN